MGCHKETQYHKLGDNENLFSSWLQRLGVWNQCMLSWPCCCWSFYGRVCFMLFFLVFDWYQQSLVFLGYRYITQSLPLLTLDVLSVCLCLYKEKALFCVSPLHLQYYTHSTTGHQKCMRLWGEGSKPRNSQSLKTQVGALKVTEFWHCGDNIRSYMLRAQSCRLCPHTHFRCQLQVQVVTQRLPRSCPLSIFRETSVITLDMVD